MPAVKLNLMWCEAQGGSESRNVVSSWCEIKTSVLGRLEKPDRQDVAQVHPYRTDQVDHRMLIVLWYTTTYLKFSLTHPHINSVTWAHIYYRVTTGPSRCRLTTAEWDWINNQHCWWNFTGNSCGVKKANKPASKIWMILISEDYRSDCQSCSV